MESNTNAQVKIDENGWVTQIKERLDVLYQQEVEEEELCASVFNVPKEFLALKRQAYIPQSVSIGPYHHGRPELFDMERYKLAAVCNFQTRINGRNFESVIVEEFKKHDWQIRSCYRKFIDYKTETLAWLMALDAAFLLECLQFYVRHADQSSHAEIKQPGRVLYPTATGAVYNSVLRDLMMLENQLPLFLLQKLLELQMGSITEAEESLRSLVRLVCEELSPFSFKVREDSEFNIKKGGHVLEVLYYAIVPTSVSYNQNPNPIDDEESGTSHTVDMSTVSQASGLLGKTLSALNVRPTRLLKVLRGNLTNPTVLSAHTRPLAFLVNKDTIKNGEESSVKIIPPSRHELNIPSVADLYFTGVKFSPAHGDLTTLRFDEKTATLYLPRIILDANTEIILRNLVALEAAAAPGAPVLRRYIDFMNGLIDCENDVRLLRNSRIISNHLKNDGEVASLWNSMGNCIRVPNFVYLDKAIEDLNRYHNRTWKAVVVKFVDKHIFGCWKFLSLAAATIMLILTFLQTYCQVYTCKRLLYQSSN